MRLYIKPTTQIYHTNTTAAVCLGAGSRGTGEILAPRRRTVEQDDASDGATGWQLRRINLWEDDARAL